MPLIVCLLFVTYYEGKYNMDGSRRALDKEITLDYAPSFENVDLNSFRSSLIVATIFIGVMCALLGIGGGELLSPLMLSIHVIPLVTSATSGSLEFATTVANVVRTLSSSGFSSFQLSGILFCVGLVGGFAGRKTGLHISISYNRASYVIFALVVGLYLTCVYYIMELSEGNLSSTLENLC